ncbi:hypothetical protein [Conexibacter woesei]|uniref:Uncharacterized protein n=1 Tax=Conexibacter woesei (strain DSM 14684 / CCUG 47730 / CIP 108061 / JCM 11494 / NBRC 100937 / ID131577) TaxID=469383 RepID=D3F340_CONWI|nr:hypothetical protein [Conexibacter woesei]ADB50320.1 hypothetical protein Cwoe_1894 [Conexibacter woesei DSM 14684]
MSTAGWIFLVGMRVIDLGGMIVWLVWFFRHQDEPDEWGDWDDPGRDPPPDRPSPPDPGDRGDCLPLPDAAPWPVRLRDHTTARPRGTERERRGEPARRERERARSARAG